MKDKYEYMLHTWGGFYNEEHKHGKKPGYFFFNSMEELNEYLAELRLIEKEMNARLLATTIEEGTHVRYKTVAKMKLYYLGNDYDYECDFGYGYPTEAAEYMLHDGNYSCDCNRSIFLHNKYGVPEKDCGHDIEMKDFEIVLVKGSSAKEVYETT